MLALLNSIYQVTMNKNVFNNTLSCTFKTKQETINIHTIEAVLKAKHMYPSRYQVTKVSSRKLAAGHFEYSVAILKRKLN